MGSYIAFIHNVPVTTSTDILGVISNKSNTEVISINRVFILNLNARNMNQCSYNYALTKIEGIQDISLQQIGQIVPQNKSCINLDSIIVGASNNNTYGGTQTQIRRSYGGSYAVGVTPTSDLFLRFFREYSCVYDNNNPTTQPIVLRYNEALAVINTGGISNTGSPIIVVFEFTN